MNPRSATLVACSIALGITVLVPIAWAADRFAMTCIENKTSITLRYSRKWGDGAWESRSVAPGARISHTWEFAPGKKTAPTLYVRFDDDLSAKVKSREYRLQSHAAPQKTDCIRYGREYHFVYDGSAKKYIDLVSVR